nr:MAG TPA: hypothetical protein [Caudoviricetes sp.]DAH58773.1 MAG TPA: hypothetical protein [Caudoviricetes sp.]
MNPAGFAPNLYRSITSATYPSALPITPTIRR